jgi:DICT domain-containing protein
MNSMHPHKPDAQPVASMHKLPATLTIGDLASRTGLQPATLRMWESRHGFPRAERRVSGHRRYCESDVELVRQVIRRRDSGARLEVAIAEVALAHAAVEDPPGAPSVYARMRRDHPDLQPQRLTKSTLIALSWAIEDECCTRAERPVIFGGFQHERFFRAAEERWTDLARIARSTMVFADFTDPTSSAAGVDLVHLPPDAPMRREWVVVCDAAGYPAMLTAWELPGQSTVADRHRLFEALWTVEPAAVRSAARACAQVALQLGHDEAAPLLYELASNPPPPPVELRRAAGLLNRVVAYVDAARLQPGSES